MYDVIVIGAGWAGINAAIAASKLGLKTALVEKDKLGGLCLNHGCIPTKSYLESARLLYSLKKSSDFGIYIKEPQLDFPSIYKRKNQIIKNLSKGLEQSLKSKKIDLYYSAARFKSANEVLINNNLVKAKNIILATGSKPYELEGLRFNAKTIISSDDILNLENLPKSLLIVGGGVIGCEFAWIFANFGVQVKLIEKENYLLPQEDEEVSKKIELIFRKNGIEVETKTKGPGLDVNKFEKALVCIGRIPNFNGLDIENAGLQKNDKKLYANEFLQTNVGHIYLAGDITANVFLAPKAAYEGRLAATNIFNSLTNKEKQKADYSLIPNCIFVYPEIASIGINCENKARDESIDYDINRFDLKANGKSYILGETNGLIKIFVEKKSGKILGGTIFSPGASELVNILATALSLKAKIEDFKKLIFTHPSISESILEVE